jgi:hypothetical protein
MGHTCSNTPLVNVFMKLHLFTMNFYLQGTSGIAIMFLQVIHKHIKFDLIFNFSNRNTTSTQN